MLQINALTIIFGAVFYEYWQGRNNPLSRQVIERMKKNNKKNTFTLTGIEGIIRSKLSTVEKRAELKLARANLDFTPYEYISFLMIGVLVGALIGVVIFPLAGLWKSAIFFTSNNYVKISLGRMLCTVVMAALGSLTPALWVQYLIRKRRKELNAQLLEFLMSLADGTMSSPTIQTALSIVAQELPDPISSELKKTIQEIEYAKPFDEALESLAERIDIKEYRLAIDAIQIQDKTGGELEKLLRNMAKVFQERQELMAEVNKIVRGPKTTSYILLAAPFAFIGIFSFVTEDFFETLFSTVIGFGCAVAAVIMFVIAFFAIRKINKYLDKVF